MKNRIKMIGIDLDGTLLNGQKVLTEYTMKVLRRVIDKGVIVLPATGRALAGIPKELREFPGMDYALTANGGRILNMKSGETLYESLVEIKSAEKILDVFSQYDTLKEVYFDGISYVDRSGYENLEVYAEPSMLEYCYNTKNPVENIREKIYEMNCGIDKLNALFRHTEERAEAFERLRASSDVTVSTSLRNNIEVNGKNVNKGKGLVKLGGLLGIKTEEIMACGDGLNDLQMMREVGFAVAMGNADAAVKEEADFVTLTNEEDGVARAIEKFVLEN